MLATVLHPEKVLQGLSRLANHDHNTSMVMMNLFVQTLTTLLHDQPALELGTFSKFSLANEILAAHQHAQAQWVFALRKESRCSLIVKCQLVDSGQIQRAGDMDETARAQH